MKRAIFITILILVFCVVVFAQSDENICPKIKIKAAEHIWEGDTTGASASFEKEKQPSTSKFNWTIIKANKLTRIAERGIIEIDSEDMKGGETLVLLADSLDKTCQNTAVAIIPVIKRVGSPLIFDEYSELAWNEEQARLDAVLISMQNIKEDELFIFVNFEKTTSQVKRKTYLTKILNYLTVTRRLEKNRMTFLISEAERKIVRFQPVQQNMSADVFGCDECLLIRGEDLDKLNNLFQPNPKLKKNN